MDDAELLAVLHRAADAVGEALATQQEWGLAGTRAGQHHSDLAADEAALGVLEATGLAILSEESGPSTGASDHAGDAGVIVVVDPLDGSTNASRRLPWYATSLCALDGHGPRVAVVANQASGVRYEAVRGGGARRDGSPVRASGCEMLAEALMGIAGLPPGSLGWSQFRSLGSAALDMCLVAEGVLDAYVDCSSDGHAPWDYLGALLVCEEAGAVVLDAGGRDLDARGWHDRRAPVAAATPALAHAIVERRSRLVRKIG